MNAQKKKFRLMGLSVAIAIMAAACAPAAPAAAPAAPAAPAAEAPKPTEVPKAEAPKPTEAPKEEVKPTEAPKAEAKPAGEVAREDTVIFDIDGNAIQSPDVWNPMVPGSARNQGLHQSYWFLRRMRTCFTRRKAALQNVVG